MENAQPQTRLACREACEQPDVAEAVGFGEAGIVRRHERGVVLKRDRKLRIRDILGQSPPSRMAPRAIPRSSSPAIWAMAHPVRRVRVCYWRSSSYILIVVALQSHVVGQPPRKRSIHMEKISLPIQTLFADLEQRASDAEFLTFFEKTGSFKRRKRKNRYYWYFQNRVGDEVQELYVGPVTDNNVTDKVERFNEIKADFVERREIVKALLSAGLPQTDIVAGRVIEALAEGGFFRMRGVLIGTTAYQCYAGISGVKLGLTTVRTQDADFAQYLSIAPGNEMTPLLLFWNY